MRAVIRKWGNSAAIRIPAAVMEAGNLRLDRAVDIREEKGCVVIKPVEDESASLVDLLDGITPDNLHAECDFGAAVGREAF
ncbi:MAG: AbrB/MazE/SpoVT family DNA-binding domain-containing protein [Nevskiaceae bacterium]|nr:MAG: AbrB/MazE/SpoVT family DNA-binding domain-containing protein [Nevskiaceae bacterium]TBR74853.1 MAG: AbrB/MazE/SpoVT family DNA-binding domain-containing protein [Nevskiaceae bacterium]